MRRRRTPKAFNVLLGIGALVAAAAGAATLTPATMRPAVTKCVSNNPNVEPFRCLEA
jgi:hypothetical protein